MQLGNPQTASFLHRFLVILVYVWQRETVFSMCAAVLIHSATDSQSRIALALSLTCCDQMGSFMCNRILATASVSSVNILWSGVLENISSTVRPVCSLNVTSYSSFLGKLFLYIFCLAVTGKTGGMGTHINHSLPVKCEPTTSQVHSMHISQPVSRQGKAGNCQTTRARDGNQRKLQGRTHKSMKTESIYMKPLKSKQIVAYFSSNLQEGWSAVVGIRLVSIAKLLVILSDSRFEKQSCLIFFKTTTCRTKQYLLYIDFWCNCIMTIKLYIC